MNPYLLAFSTPVFSKIHFYFEEKRQHAFVAVFRNISMLLVGGNCVGTLYVLTHLLPDTTLTGPDAPDTLQQPLAPSLSVLSLPADL